MATVALFVAGAFAALVLLPKDGAGPSRGHPEPNPVGGYVIELSMGGAPFDRFPIGAEGSNCERLRDPEANRTCLIATNLIPSVIGGEAYGELNTRRTPAFDALVWRGRANADATVCARGGLENEYLADCERLVADESYTYTRDQARVHVPIGGATDSERAQP